MKKYKVTIHFHYIVGGSIEKDHDTHFIEAMSEEHAKLKASNMYGSRYVPFKFEVTEVMTKELLFNLTNPFHVRKIQEN